MRQIIFLLSLCLNVLYLSAAVAQSPTCKEWFRENKIPTKNCLSLCNTSPTDLNTFTCSLECEILCQVTKDLCEINVSLIKKSTLPQNWPWPKDRTVDLNKNEEESLLAALKSINPDLLKQIKGIFVLEKPKDFSLIGTDSTYFEDQVILFHSFFKNPNDMQSKLTHELGHHLHEKSHKLVFQEYRKKISKPKRILF